jgi:hypothetical protein
MKETGVPKLVYGATVTGRREVCIQGQGGGTNSVKTAQACHCLCPVAAVALFSLNFSTKLGLQYRLIVLNMFGRCGWQER